MLIWKIIKNIVTICIDIVLVYMGIDNNSKLNWILILLVIIHIVVTVVTHFKKKKEEIENKKKIKKEIGKTIKEEIENAKKENEKKLEEVYYFDYLPKDKKFIIYANINNDDNLLVAVCYKSDVNDTKVIAIGFVSSNVCEKLEDDELNFIVNGYAVIEIVWYNEDIEKLKNIVSNKDKKKECRKMYISPKISKTFLEKNVYSLKENNSSSHDVSDVKKRSKYKKRKKRKGRRR